MYDANPKGLGASYSTRASLPVTRKQFEIAFEGSDDGLETPISISPQLRRGEGRNSRQARADQIAGLFCSSMGQSIPDVADPHTVEFVASVGFCRLISGFA